jgi:hypothetical protein
VTVPSPSYAPEEEGEIGSGESCTSGLSLFRNFQAPIRLQYAAHDNSRTYGMWLILCARNVSNVQSRNTHPALTKNIQLACTRHAFRWNTPDVYNSPDPFSLRAWRGLGTRLASCVNTSRTPQVAMAGTIARVTTYQYGCFTKWHKTLVCVYSWNAQLYYLKELVISWWSDVRTQRSRKHMTSLKRRHNWGIRNEYNFHK